MGRRLRGRGRSGRHLGLDSDLEDTSQKMTGLSIEERGCDWAAWRRTGYTWNESRGARFKIEAVQSGRAEVSRIDGFKSTSRNVRWGQSAVEGRELGRRRGKKAKMRRVTVGGKSADVKAGAERVGRLLVITITQ